MRCRGGGGFRVVGRYVIENSRRRRDMVGGGISVVVDYGGSGMYVAERWREVV